MRDPRGIAPRDERQVARTLGREQAHQSRVDEQFLASHLDLLRHACARQILQIDGGGLTLRDAGVDHVPDAAVQLHRFFGGPDGKIATMPLDARVTPRDNPRRVVRPLCVLIGPGTFSSAMLLANSVKQGRLGFLIGEPTGEPPNSFGEVYAFRLPMSGLQGQVSSSEFVLDRDPTARSHGVLPDIDVSRSAADVAAGRDPALDRDQVRARER